MNKIFCKRHLGMLAWGCIASMLWLAFSCEEFCEDPNRTAVVVNFYNSTSNALEKVKNVWIRGIENDSALYDPKDNNKAVMFGGRDFSQVLLPVNPSSDLMSFSIQNDTFPPDTIIIRYTRRNGFVSPKCGCVTYAEIQGEPERTENTIRRMDVVNPNVTIVSYRTGVINAENIRIYY